MESGQPSVDTQAMDALIRSILQDYEVHEPPVPVERILSNPPAGLERVDVSDLSLVFGIGDHRHEYRLALGRLLYRELCRTGRTGDGLPPTTDAARTFAMMLLLPTPWLSLAVHHPRVTLRRISEFFKAPEYAVATRLAHLGLSVRGMH